MADAKTQAEERLQRLLSFVEHDPSNLTLLSDASETALAAGRPEIARDMLDRYANHSPLSEKEQNTAGLTALDLNDFKAASDLFLPLLRANPNNPALQFNLAWALTRQKRFAEALDVLSAASALATAQAATLRVQLLHKAAMLEDAVAEVQTYLQHFPDYPPLAAAASVLGVDVEDLEFARECAARAGDHPDALTTLGLLALADERNVEALGLFDRALEKTDQIPRAWVGRGLARMLAGEHQQAAKELDRGAAMFGDHLGSWIAAGWAHLMANDLEAAKKCFEHSIELDRNFSESYGSLAVIALMSGDRLGAESMTRTSLRLDSGSFSGALAQAMLLSSSGDSDKARRLIERALNTPIDANGRTIAQSLTRLGLNLH